MQNVVMVMKHVKALRTCGIEASNQMLSILWECSKFMLATQKQFRRDVKEMLRLKERDCRMNTIGLDMPIMNKIGQKDYLSLPRNIGYGHSIRVYNIHCNTRLFCHSNFNTNWRIMFYEKKMKAESYEGILVESQPQRGGLM